MGDLPLELLSDLLSADLLCQGLCPVPETPWELAAVTLVDGAWLSTQKPAETLALKYYQHLSIPLLPLSSFLSKCPLFCLKCSGW